MRHAAAHRHPPARSAAGHRGHGCAQGASAGRCRGGGRRIAARGKHRRGRHLCAHVPGLRLGAAGCCFALGAAGRSELAARTQEVHYGVRRGGICGVRERVEGGMRSVQVLWEFSFTSILGRCACAARKWCTRPCTMETLTWDLSVTGHAPGGAGRLWVYVCTYVSTVGRRWDEKPRSRNRSRMADGLRLLLCVIVNASAPRRPAKNRPAQMCFPPAADVPPGRQDWEGTRCN